MKLGMLQSGNDYFLETATPYHYLKDIPFKKLVSSDKIRKNPMFFGPYKVSKAVRGQSVTWVPNKYYWRGTPKLNRLSPKWFQLIQLHIYKSHKLILLT